MRRMTIRLIHLKDDWLWLWYITLILLIQLFSGFVTLKNITTFQYFQFHIAPKNPTSSLNFLHINHNITVIEGSGVFIRN